MGLKEIGLYFLIAATLAGCGDSGIKNKIEKKVGGDNIIYAEMEEWGRSKTELYVKKENGDVYQFFDENMDGVLDSYIFVIDGHREKARNCGCSETAAKMVKEKQKDFDYYLNLVHVN